MAPAYQSSGAEWWHLIIALKESRHVAWHVMGRPAMVWLWGPMLSFAGGSDILIGLMGLRASDMDGQWWFSWSMFW
jgi:hypothetical protein